METEEWPCDLCTWSGESIYKTICYNEQRFNVCIDCYVKIIEEILEKSVEDEHERGKLIIQEFKLTKKLNKRIEWDIDRPPLIDNRPPSNGHYFPENYQGLMELKNRP
jgi:hypothetical protein